MATMTQQAGQAVEYENLERWKRPSNYVGASWTGYYWFLGRHRDSGCLDNSNFECGYKAVKAVASKESVPGDEDESATVVTVCENHWAVGWVEWIAIHESDTTALVLANAIAGALAHYPVLDEHDFSQRESDEANEVWAKCYRVKERVAYIRKHASQFEFRDYADMLGCVRGNYFAGYANELVNG